MEPDDGGITWLYIARQIWGRGSQDTAGGSTGWGERRGPGRPARGRGAGGRVRNRRRSFLDEGALGTVDLWDWDLV